MIRFVLRRLAVAIPLVAVVATISFFLIQLVPGSPAAAILGNNATGAQVTALNHQLGLDRPVLTEYLTWLGHAVQGNLGVSYTNGGQSVTSELSQALPPTLSLALLATLITLVLGTVLGTVAAVRGGHTDRAVQWGSSLGMAVPNFWLAALLVFVFAIKISLFPATGYVNLTASPGQWLSHLILPVVALSVANVGQIAFQARAAVRDTLSRDFVRTLHSTGVPRWRILYKHTLRNAAIPVVTVTGLTFIFTLGGVVILEQLFTLPGMGELMLRSVQTHDFSTVQGAVLYFSIVVIVVNLVVDLATAALDPRVRIR